MLKNERHFKMTINNKKLIVFGDSSSFITHILYKKLVQEITNSNFEIVKVVNTTPFISTNYTKKLLVFIVKKLFNPFDNRIKYNKYPTFLQDVDKSLLLETANVNDKNFIAKINHINPDVALLIGCPQIFKSEIIGCFAKVINYHNSLLPKYRGLEATSWSMQYNETYTGFTYHYVDKGIDTGNIIIQDQIEIDYEKSSRELEIEKTKLAAKQLTKLLSLVLEGYEGITQSGANSYFGNKDKAKLLTRQELKDRQMIEKLIYIWGGIFVQQHKRTIFVTRIKNGKITRINYLPPFVFYLYQTVKSVFSYSGKSDTQY